MEGPGVPLLSDTRVFPFAWRVEWRGPPHHLVQSAIDTGEEIKAQRSLVSCPRSHSELGTCLDQMQLSQYPVVSGVQLLPWGHF